MNHSNGVGGSVIPFAGGWIPSYPGKSDWSWVDVHINDRFELTVRDNQRLTPHFWACWLMYWGSRKQSLKARVLDNTPRKTGRLISAWRLSGLYPPNSAYIIFGRLSSCCLDKWISAILIWAPILISNIRIAIMTFRSGQILAHWCRSPFWSWSKRVEGSRSLMVDASGSLDWTRHRARNIIAWPNFSNTDREASRARDIHL